MAHEFDSGFFVRQPAWHGLGTVLDSAPENWEAARKLAGLDWDPIQQPVYAKRLAMSPAGEMVETFEEIPGWNELVRSDTYSTLAIGKESYEVISNGDMGMIVEALGHVYGDKYKIDTMGSLAGGEKVWALLELGEPIQLKGDPSLVRRYACIMNRHDGHGACKLIATNVRVVCANTFHYSETNAEAEGATYTFSHTKNWRERLKEVAEQAKEAVAAANKEIAALTELSEDLLNMRVTKEQEKRFLNDFIFPEAEEWRLKARARMNMETEREKLADAYNSPTCEGIRGTAYGLWQVGIEWADHLRPHKDKESLVGRALLNRQDRKLRAKNLAVLAGEGRL